MIDKYYKYIKDKNVYKLTPAEAYGYTAMRLRQQGKDIPACIHQYSLENPKDLIARAYVESILFKKRIGLTENLKLPEKMVDQIYDMYLFGTLPIRMGGLDHLTF